MSFASVIAFAMIAQRYQMLRAEFPAIRAQTIHDYIKDDQGLTLQEFRCGTEWGHDWAYSDMDRCYCMTCGADGDA